MSPLWRLEVQGRGPTEMVGAFSPSPHWQKTQRGLWGLSYKDADPIWGGLHSHDRITPKAPPPHHHLGDEVSIYKLDNKRCLEPPCFSSVRCSVPSWGPPPYPPPAEPARRKTPDSILLRTEATRPLSPGDTQWLSSYCRERIQASSPERESWPSFPHMPSPPRPPTHTLHSGQDKWKAGQWTSLATSVCIPAREAGDWVSCGRSSLPGCVSTASTVYENHQLPNGLQNCLETQCIQHQCMGTPGWLSR